MLPITTSLVWHPHTEKPVERPIVIIAIDRGPETPPEAMRIEPLFGLYMWDADQFFSLTTCKPLADENYFWTPIFDAVNQLEEAVMNQTADIVKGLIVKMTHQRPTVPGWYWASIPRNMPLQPVLVFDGGEGFGLLYTFSYIDDDHDDSDRDGLGLDVAANCMLWSNEPIALPEATP